MKAEILLTRIEDGSRNTVWIDQRNRSDHPFDTATWPLWLELAQMIASYDQGIPTIVLSDTGRRRSDMSTVLNPEGGSQ